MCLRRLSSVDDVESALVLVLLLLLADVEEDEEEEEDVVDEADELDDEKAVDDEDPPLKLGAFMFVIELLRAVFITDGELDLDKFEDEGD